MKLEGATWSPLRVHLSAGVTERSQCQRKPPESFIGPKPHNPVPHRESIFHPHSRCRGTSRSANTDARCCDTSLVESLTRSRSYSRGVCPSLTFVNTMTKATSGREGFSWFTLLGYSPSPREVRTDASAKMKQKWCGNVAYGLTVWLMPSWIP